MDRKKIVWEVYCNIAVALTFGFFLYYQGLDYSKTHRTSSLLIILKESLDVGFVLFRRFPTRTSKSSFAWLVAFGGTMFPLFLRPVESPTDWATGTYIQYFGSILQLIAMFSILRSIGIIPAQREIKTAGLYRFVRHPLYMSYIITFSGYLINNYNSFNVACVVLATVCQLARIFEEEKFLAADAQYRQYMERVKWRLLPFVF